MTSFNPPTQQQIDTAVDRIRSPELAAYFLSRLENPLWVSIFNEKGVLESPPPPISVESGGVSYPHWPASKYLARMATLVPDEVVQIFSKLETDNPSIISDILDGALTMPANTGNPGLETWVMTSPRVIWQRESKGESGCDRLLCRQYRRQDKLLQSSEKPSLFHSGKLTELIHPAML